MKDQYQRRWWLKDRKWIYGWVNSEIMILQCECVWEVITSCLRGKGNTDNYREKSKIILLHAKTAFFFHIFVRSRPLTPLFLSVVIKAFLPERLTWFTERFYLALCSHSSKGIFWQTMTTLSLQHYKSRPRPSVCMAKTLSSSCYDTASKVSLEDSVVLQFKDYPRSSEFLTQGII